MTSSTNNMLITAQGLLKISRELISKRVYDSSKITIVGSPIVSSEGTAKALDTGSYFQQTGMEFSDDDSIKITFDGTFATSTGSHYSCAWSLNSSEEGYNPLNVACYSNKVSLLEGSNELAVITGLSLGNDTRIKIEVELNKDSFGLTVVANDSSTYQGGTFETPTELSKYTSMFIGTFSANSEDFWKGSIYLPEFLIMKGYDIYYTPSKDNIFNFTKILISDGYFPLTNTSGPLLNHVYEFPVEEISRSGSNVLLKATIDNNTHLNIKQVGLYSVASDETQLFSLIDNLSIKKGSDIGYDLIFHINIDLGVVNTNLYPTVILNEKEYSKLQDFNIIKKVHCNDIVDMERAIDRNSVELGYNAAQTYCRLQDKITLWEQNLTGSRIFRKAKERYKYTETTVFDPGKVSLYGSIEVTDNGIASGFSETNYITFPGSRLDSNTLSFNFRFTTGFNVSRNQPLIYSSSTSTIKPIEVSIKNNKMLFSLGQLERLFLINEDDEILEYSRWNTETILGVTYYSWLCTDFSQEVSTILTLDLTPNSQTILYDDTGAQLSGYTFSRFSYGPIFSEASLDVSPLTNYFIKMEFDGNIYSLKYSTDGNSYSTFASRVYNLKPGYLSDLNIGRMYDSSTQLPFEGSINLYDLLIKLDDQKFSPTKIIYDKVNLEDFFYIPEYKYSAYKVNNMNNKSESQLEILEDSITGNADSIDFSVTEGFTLCVKTYLQDASDKIILSKVDLENEDIYFELSYINNLLSFNLYRETGVITLKRQLDTQTFRDFTDNPILLTVTKSEDSASPTFRLYKNNTLIDEVIDTPTDFLDAEDFQLTNYLTSETKSEAVNCVQGIYSFKAPLTSEKLYYLNNILDTNFDSEFNLIISSSTDDPITSLNVTYKGEVIATLSDFIAKDGTYSIKLKYIPKGDEVIVTSTGFLTKTVALIDPTIKVSLVPEN